jgi:hypothetical protein
MDLVSPRNTDEQKKKTKRHASTRYVQLAAGRVQLAAIRAALEEPRESMGDAPPHHIVKRITGR